MEKIKTSEKYIDHHKENSWRVKIAVGDQYIQKFFNFTKYGGHEIALAAAIKCRNKILKEHDLIHRIKKKNHFQTHSLRKNKPMIVGVRIVHNKYNKIGGTVYWVAIFSTSAGKKCKRHYSIDKYGFNKAFLLACRERYKHCGVLSVYHYDKLPCEPDVPFVVR